jgi:hypothetical protein
MIVAAAAIAATAIAGNHWFQLLFVFVGFNTIIYAALAFTKLWPRHRR